MRITPITIANDMIFNLENTYQTIETTGKELSSGKQINQPSDNPAGTAYALDLQTALDWNKQSQSISQTALGWMQSTNAALQQLSDTATKARTLAVQGANDTNTPSDRTALANQVTQLLNEAVQIGNTVYGDGSLFAGTMTQTTPFNSNGGYLGNTGAVHAQIAPGYSMQINTNPTAIFSGATGLLATLKALANHLNTTSTLQATQNTGAEALALTGVYAGAPANVTTQVTAVTAGAVSGIKYSTDGGVTWTAVAGVGTPPTFALPGGVTGGFTPGAIAPAIGDQFSYSASAGAASAFAVQANHSIGNEAVTLTSVPPSGVTAPIVVKPATLDANNNITGIQISTDGGVTFGFDGHRE